MWNSAPALSQFRPVGVGQRKEDEPLDPRGAFLSDQDVRGFQLPAVSIADTREIPAGPAPSETHSRERTGLALARSLASPWLFLVELPRARSAGSAIYLAILSTPILHPH